MNFYKIRLLLLLCCSVQAAALSAQAPAEEIAIMSYGDAKELSDPASVLDIKSPTDMAADGLANSVMVCWATSTEIQFTYTDVTGTSSSGTVTSTSELVKPSVATDKNGKWLLTWRDGMDIKVTTSNDNGTNWSTAIIISSSPNNLLQNISDPVIETSGNGLWKVVWGEATSSNWLVYGASSSNNGATWSAPILIKSHAITAGVLTGINYLDLAANGTDNWLIAWTLQERTFSSNTITDQTTLWSASCDGSGWTTAQTISQCPIINDPSLANDGGDNWLLVWEEDALPTTGALVHQIYQKNSSDGGVTWDAKQFITAGQSPNIAHSEASEYALAFVAAEERPNAGSDADIVIRYTKDAGLNWSSPQLGNPTGKTDDGVTDAHPVLAKKTDGGWALAWNKNYAVSNEVHSKVVAATLDGSAPFGTVTSDAGASTFKSTSLDFTRTDFTDDQSGFSHYQWALGTPENPEAYIAFPADPATSQIGTLPLNKKVLPTDVPTNRADFATLGYFSKGKYVFTVRAYNGLYAQSQNDTWLYREVSVCVEVEPVKIGGDIPLPEGKVWTDIDWPNTKMRVGGALNDAYAIPVNSTDRSINTHTIWVSHLNTGEAEGRFIAADHTSTVTGGIIDNATQIPLFIQWAYTAGGTYNFEYQVVPDPAKTPMLLYHTNEYGSPNQTLVPIVDVSAVPVLQVHYNTTMPVPLVDPTVYTDIFWEDSKKLRARGTVDENDASLFNPDHIDNNSHIVLQYNNQDGSLIGFEIVLLKPNKPIDHPGIVAIGSRILPYDRDVDGNPKQTPLSTGCENECPKIVSGLSKLYVHDMNGADQHKDIWATKKSTATNGIEIYWQTRGSVEGVEVIWPFEYRQYTAPDWPKNSPEKYQEYVRAAGAVEPGGKAVTIPTVLDPALMGDQEPANSAHLNSNVFYTDDVGTGAAWSLLKYHTTSSGAYGKDWVGFEVIKSIPKAPASSTAIVGTEITDTYHEGPALGAYVYQPYGNKYAIDIQEETGQVFGVNTGDLEVWWSNLSRTTDPEGSTYPNWPTGDDFRVQWPSKVVQYDVQWAEQIEEQIIISTQTGTGAIPPDKYGTEWDLYYQNNPNLPGFNPNDEHALKIDNAIFPLRNDLKSPTSSEPYVLMSYKDPNNNDLWAFEVFAVLKETAEFPFSDWASVGRPIDKYEGDAGKLIQAPFPLSLLPIAPQNKAVSGNFFKDKNGDHWAKAAGNDGVSTEDIKMQYYYPIQPSFYLGTMFPGASVGTEVPWLPSTGDNLSGTPVDITYTIHWPDDAPTMKIGQTILEAQYGIPAIDGQCSVDVVYEQSVKNGTATDHSVLLIDPIQTRSVALAATGFPWSIGTVSGGTELDFKDLNLALRRRISYDQTTEELSLKGEKVSPVIGFDYAFLNVMSTREKTELLALSTNGTWVDAVNALYTLTKDPIVINNSSTDPYDLLALTSGLAKGVGYVTLVMQNGDQCGAAPISLEIIKVVPELETSGLAVITPSCPFDETLTMRNKGDFGGASDGVKFEWQYIGDKGGVPPTDDDTWIPFPATPATGLGAVDNTIAGPGLLTLSDNWVRCRYKITSSIPELADDGRSAEAGNPAWSDWTASQFAPGWIKRVIGDVNPFTQRASGGGIEGAEGAFFDFGEQPVNTIVSMISQAGARWVGNTPLNCDNINDFGLIEIYETVLGRGVDLSIEGIPPVNYPPANNALLLAASRISDMYMLLGNEAYADASDPTIAFSTDDNAPGGYGAVASSIHSFQNQTASLIEEELALLRGRDNANAPNVGLHPVYNNLYWNFTNGAGEVAYNANYNIQDQQGDVNGTIDEADAKVFYPQGHGDAWGHYLMATKTYYKLLTHPNYTWIPRSEAVLLGGQAITVDYFDERHFARAAAAKAQAGAEIVDLTYRSVYVEDPEGQYKGYKDEDTDRAWGFDEWADRAGQGAYIDWVVGNSILPAVDKVHTGIQKIDRTTVLALREVAVKALDIQKQVDEANTGLNPLGLATNVIPFDISPAEIDAGQTHFEQVYDRAIVAMENAVTVFNYANNSTQNLRRQNNSLNDFVINVENKESDFTNRLIEIYGYPYADDIGPGKTYPTGYAGHDKYHYNYVKASQLMLKELPATKQITAYIKELDIDPAGVPIDPINGTVYTRDVTYNISDQLGELTPDGWGERRAPGEIQMARTNLIQTYGRLKQALAEYSNLLTNIKGRAAVIKAQYDGNIDDLEIANKQFDTKETLNKHILAANFIEMQVRTEGEAALENANAGAEALPTSAGLSTDISSVARGSLKFAGQVTNWALQTAGNIAAEAQLAHEQALDLSAARTDITLTTNANNQAYLEAFNELQELIREEIPMRMELFTLQENIQQAIGAYRAILAEGIRESDSYFAFRRQTAANVQSRRYKDMAFRVFRNDALQKYRAQYDLAARYVYLAAKAYDYETTLLSGTTSGQNFLTSIIKQRLIGTMNAAVPQPGAGLADPMAKMAANFGVLKGQLGFNNPQIEGNYFSLRNELFRIGEAPLDDDEWRNTLREYVVDDVFSIPEFRRYCSPYTSSPSAQGEPAIVIPFSSTITAGLNFFGHETQGGDSSFDESVYSIKIRSAGAGFENYNTSTSDGLIETPRVYLIPVGVDIQRSPSNNNVIREFKILDQLTPTPPLMTQDNLNTDYIPIQEIVDPLSGNPSFAQIRQYATFKAYHDAGANPLDPSEIRESRLIGRSVWNTRWLLIIPGLNLLSDSKEGINRFIDGQESNGEWNGNGVSDIELFLETYSLPGN